MYALALTTEVSESQWELLRGAAAAIILPAVGKMTVLRGVTAEKTLDSCAAEVVGYGTGWVLLQGEPVEIHEPSVEQVVLRLVGVPNEG